MRIILAGMFLIMFAAKVLGYITISWWIVTAPIWMPCAIVAILFATGFVTAWWAFRGMDEAEKIRMVDKAIRKR